jgi:protein-tyrosine phosphatase
MLDFETLTADTVHYPITGYLPDGRSLNIPLISHIEDNLYVGGCINGVDLGDYFSHVFSMYVWEKYTVEPSTVVVETTMYDSRDMPVDVEAVERVSEQVIEALDAGGNVLVHCQAGINRSNLVAATVLMKRGRSAEEAIAFLRSRRSDRVLANATFENYLLYKEA